MPRPIYSLVLQISRGYGEDSDGILTQWRLKAC
jgi:hypothetical protein